MQYVSNIVTKLLVNQLLKGSLIYFSSSMWIYSQLEGYVLQEGFR